MAKMGTPSQRMRKQNLSKKAAAKRAVLRSEETCTCWCHWAEVVTNNPSINHLKHDSHCRELCNSISKQVLIDQWWYAPADDSYPMDIDMMRRW